MRFHGNCHLNNNGSCYPSIILGWLYFITFLYGFEMVKNLLVGVNITSPFQLVCFVSYLKEKSGFFDEVILYTINYWERGQIYENYLSFLSEMNVDIRPISNNRELISLVSHDIRNSHNVTFVCINSPFFPFKFIKPTCKFVIVSDGLGTYNGLIKSINVSRKEKRIKKLSYKFPLLIMKRLIVSLFYNVISHEDYMLFNPRSLKKNNLFSSSLRETLKLFGSNNSGLGKPSLIFLSQPLVQLGMLNKEEYLSCLNKAREFAKREGLEFLIKLHPTEMAVFNSLDYTGIKKYDYNGLIEEACVNDDNIKVVVSFFSSGLYSVPELSNVRTYSVMSEELFASLNFSKKQKAIIKTVPSIK
ncbi:polysialyltransferase family glycosyltransferase [Aeromonas veronii]|uniref:polysialyltransferase family glycosyltransferase n=1 Tax=Aeromonas veronii TaxID=654 RepID=UPI00406C581D